MLKPGFLKKGSCNHSAPLIPASGLYWQWLRVKPDASGPREHIVKGLLVGGNAIRQGSRMTATGWQNTKICSAAVAVYEPLVAVDCGQIGRRFVFQVTLC